MANLKRFLLLLVGIVSYVSGINSIISLGLQSKILQSSSRVKRVIFLFFLRLSSVLLSIPDFRSRYCEISLSFIVCHKGLKLIIVINSFQLQL